MTQSKLGFIFTRKFKTLVLLIVSVVPTALWSGCESHEAFYQGTQHLTFDALPGTPYIGRFVWGKPPIGQIDREEIISTEPGSGKVVTDFASGLDEIATSLIQPDGKVLACGVTNVGGGANYTFGLVRYTANGALDPTFGTGGLVKTRFFPPGGADGQTCVAMVLQPDGKIIAVGGVSADQFAAYNNWDFGMARYNPDGSLDTTFGNGGLVITDVTGNVQADGAMAVALQPDGKIVVGGSTGNRTRITVTPADFAVVRYNSNGSLDTTFGTGGKVTTDFNNDADFLSSLVIQTDGKIVTGGWTYNINTHGFDFALARYNSNGALDSSFGTSGKVVTDMSNSVSGDPGDDLITSIVLQPDSKIIAAGVAEPNRGANPTSADFALARYNPNGSLDPTFGTGGKVSTDFIGGADMINAMALQPDGKIVVAGVTDGVMDNSFSGPYLLLDNRYIPQGAPKASDFAVARYNPNGSLDPSFGTGGKAAVDFFGSLDAATKVLVRPDGNILALGFTQTTPYVPLNGQDLRNTDFASVMFLGKVLQRRKLHDFNGDGKAEYAVYRQSNGTWYSINSYDNSMKTTPFGTSSDVPVAGDYDGDGKADIAVFHGGTWNILQSSDNSTRVVQFGAAGDRPVQDDYDGDGITDVAVWRASTATWMVQYSSTGQSAQIQFGQSTDIPVNGDYDGDGKADISLFRPSTAVWSRINSSTGATITVQFGAAGDKPEVGDYDGDGVYDFAVYRPSDQTWHLQESTGAAITTQIGPGSISDIPVPADYDGDQLTDIAVFHPSDGTWQGKKSSGGTFNVQLGASGDIPIPSTDFAATTLVSISGRVTAPNGTGLRNASVSITDSNSVVRTATTSSFGFYSFSDIATGQQCTIRVSSRLYRFASQTVQVTDTLTNVDFVGLE